MRRGWRRATLLGCFALGGCLGPRSDPSAFFLLSSPPATAVGSPVPVSIGIGPISLPGYLDRPQIVVRMSENEIALSDADRWGEPLEENLARTLEANLAKLLPGSSYVVFPWSAADAPDYALELDVRRFEADVAGAVVLDAIWGLSRGGAEVDGRAARIEEPAAGPGRAAAVAAHSRALAGLSREISVAVRRAAGP